jgi:topoisomerase-4 subunit A
LNVTEPDEAKICVPAEGDMVATVGDNRKMLVFPLDEVHEINRGKGVILQRIKGGKLADARVFNKTDGLTWLDAAGRTFTLSMKELGDWVGQRAHAGKAAPKGFPRSNRFGPAFG